jgi:formylglycine-generating enzyme required for sulfatase activity
MMVVPSGSFTMGSPTAEPSRANNEGPQHKVTIGRQFALGQFELTFDEWDACVAAGGCSGYKPSDTGWGRGRHPVINVSWDDAKAYVAWLSRMTGKTYRLLSEAEYEYATRAGTTTRYPWGDDVGNNNANCDGCGSQWGNKQPAPVGSFPPNKFGLYDMVGNVWVWTEDCYHDAYGISIGDLPDLPPGSPMEKFFDDFFKHHDGDAPNNDGTAWTAGDCSRRVGRGGSWGFGPNGLRSASRSGYVAVLRDHALGFRVARTLSTP